jgi:diacylglycerol kinase (ATP)
MAGQKHSTMTEPRWTLPSRARSFSYAFAGLSKLIREPNARIHAGATLAVVITAAALRVSTADWRWLILAIVIVWIAEAFNTALERACDAISTAPHPSIGAAKDIAAGAVLLAAGASALIGFSVFWPYAAGKS